MRIIYLPLSQYTLHELQDTGTEEDKPNKQIWGVFKHLDRFPSESLDSLNDLFTKEVVTAFFDMLSGVDMLHWMKCKTEKEDKVGHFLVISEYLHGDDYEDREINGQEYPLKKSEEFPNGILVQLDYYKTRNIYYDSFDAIQPQENILDALRSQQEILVAKVRSLLKESQERLYLEHEVTKLRAQIKSTEQIESIYGSINIEDMLAMMNVICKSIFSASDNPTVKEIAATLEEQKNLEPPKEIDEDDELQRLIKEVEYEEEDLPTTVLEEEDEEDEDDLPEEDRLVDVLDDMDRKELKAYIVANNLEIRVKKGWEDDYIRDRILEETEPDEDDYEDTEEELDIEGDGDDDSFEGGDDAARELEESLTGGSNFPDDSKDVEEGLELDSKEENKSNILDIGIEYKEQVEDFIALMKQTNPSMQFPSNKKIVKKTCVVLEKIARIDEQDIDELFEALTWAIQDGFWKNQIISLAALRKESSNGLHKYQNICNSYLKALEKETDPAETKVEGFKKLED